MHSAVAFLGVCALVAIVASMPYSTMQNEPKTFPVQIEVDAGHKEGPFHEIWRFFGADEPNYATTPNGEKLLAELGKLRANQVFFRAHNLLTSGDGKPALKWGSTNAYTEDSKGNPIYDWTILDKIFDAYRKRRIRPYVEIGFMPEALSIHPEPYRHNWGKAKNAKLFTGWAYPPKDYAKWEELVYRWVNHCIARYGRQEVEYWFWEVWNEPNIGYLQGTPQEFLKLHDFAIAGVRRALPTARVGGPDTAGGGKYFSDFIEHCLRAQNSATGQTGTPLNFVSFHAKGSPSIFDGHIRMGISNQLRTIDENFRIVASFPELKDIPIVIGESDPEGCAACQGPSFSYRNGTVYSSYTAAVFARKLDLAKKYGVNLDGALTWAFTFADQPYFAGFRQLATEGIDLPVLNVFRMYGQMGGERVSSDSSSEIPLEEIVKDGVRRTPDVGSLASLGQKKLAIMVWHYHDDDMPGPAAAITIHLTNLPISGMGARLTEFRIDRDHSNSFTAWQAMGSPQEPTASQVRALVRAGHLERVKEQPRQIAISNGQATIQTILPRQGVSLFLVEWS